MVRRLPLAAWAFCPAWSKTTIDMMIVIIYIYIYIYIIHILNMI